MSNIETNRGPLRRIQAAAINTRNALAPRSGLQWQPLDKNVRILHVPEPTSQNIPDADVVFATGWQTAEYVFQYPGQKGRKYYIVMDFDTWAAGREVHERSWHLPLRKVTISSWLYDHVRAAGCPASEVTNIPIGINFDQFQLFSDIPNRPKRILMLYSSSKTKGPDDGLKALRKCKERHPDLDVVLFGSAWRFRPPGLPDWASYRGILLPKELARLFNESRIFVCSSVAEGFALPPAEAMACGCAVASTDCGGNREYARDGENLLLSAPQDPDGLAKNILRLLDDDRLRVALAKDGCEFISRFSWSTATDRLEEVMMADTSNAPVRFKLTESVMGCS